MTDTRQWLEQHGLGKYAEVFAENELTLAIIPELTENDLRELGLPMGPRKQLLKAVAVLAGAESETVQPTAKEVVQDSTPAPAGEAERRQLTVMFCDLVGSTALSEQMDPEEYREVLATYQSAASRAIQQYDGYIARYLGDGLLVYFGYPHAHEEDAERAVRAGLSLVEGVSALKPSGVPELRVRIGIATGLVVAGDIVGEGASEERAVLGETPNLAARLQSVAPPNGIVIAESAHSLVEGLFECESLGAQSLKGISVPVTAYQIQGESAARSRFEAAAERGLTPLVGREAEIHLLFDRWAQARDGEGQVVVLSGEAGRWKVTHCEGLSGARRGHAREPLALLLLATPPEQRVAPARRPARARVTLRTR